MNMVPLPKSKPSYSPNHSEIRKIFLTGGIIVGKVNDEGKYVSGAMSKEDQIKLIGEALNKKVRFIGMVNVKGSQNLTDAHVSAIAHRLKKHTEKPENAGKGIILTAGADKLVFLTYALRMLLPNPAVPVVLTAAMCPPGGDKKGIASYEDGPVNLKNSELLLKQMEASKNNDIVAVMENRAYGSNIKKIKPSGVENAFSVRYGLPEYRLDAIRRDISFVDRAGDANSLKWRRVLSNKLPETQTPSLFDKSIQNIISKMQSRRGLSYIIVSDVGQNSIGAEIRRAARYNNVIGYRGVGDGNINEKDALKEIERSILRGERTLVRGTQSDVGAIVNDKGEAANVPIFGKYRLVDFMVPQGPFSIENTTRTVAMINALGLKAPDRNKNESLKNFLERYKEYIKKVTTAIFSKHPLITAHNFVAAEEAADVES